MRVSLCALVFVDTFDTVDGSDGSDEADETENRIHDKCYEYI